MTDAQLPFVKISTAQHKLSLLSEIQAKEMSSTFGLAGRSQLGVKVLRVEGFNVFVEIFPIGSELLCIDQNGIFNFRTNEGVVFVHTQLKKVDGQLLFNLEHPDFFSIQRRDNFRSPVPESIKGEIKFFDWTIGTQKTLVSSSFHLLNLSVNGCALLLDEKVLKQNPDFALLKVGQSLKIELDLLDREPIKGLGVVKNIKSESNLMRVGFEFDFSILGDKAKAVQAEIQQVLLQIHRIAFTRFKDLQSNS